MVVFIKLSRCPCSMNRAFSRSLEADEYLLEFIKTLLFSSGETDARCLYNLALRIIGYEEPWLRSQYASLSWAALFAIAVELWFIALCFSCCDCSKHEFHFSLSKARSNFNWRLLAPGLITCIVAAEVIAVDSYCCWLRFTVRRRTLVEALRDFFK